MFSGRDLRRCRANQAVPAQTEEIVVALDWTDFDDDDHTTLSAYLVTRRGRAMPLVWKTVSHSKLEPFGFGLSATHVKSAA